MERELNKALIRINADMPCYIFYFGKELCSVKAHDYTEIFLPKGKHRLSFISIENQKDKICIEKEILDVEYEDIIDVKLFPIRNSRLAKQHAEEERLATIRKERLKYEEEQKEAARIAEIERRKKQERSSPLKFTEFPYLNFYDDIYPIWYRYGDKNQCMYIIAKKNNMLTIINQTTLLPILPFEYEDIHICNGNAENLWVKVKGLWGLFNIITKSYIIPPQFYDINYTSNHSLNCYTLIVTKGAFRGNGGKCGAVNDDGKIIIPCIYDNLYGTPYGEYYQGKIRGKEGLLDANGHIVLDFIYDSLCCYNSRGKYPSILNGKYGVFAYGGKKYLILFMIKLSIVNLLDVAIMS